MVVDAGGAVVGVAEVGVEVPGTVVSIGLGTVLFFRLVGGGVGEVSG